MAEHFLLTFDIRTGEWRIPASELRELLRQLDLDDDVIDPAIEVLDDRRQCRVTFVYRAEGKEAAWEFGVRDLYRAAGSGYPLARFLDDVTSDCVPFLAADLPKRSAWAAEMPLRLS
jgi:hypothetical protein